MSIRFASRAFELSFVLFAACALALSGCSKGSGKATVSGSIKYKGEPLPSGRVAFYGANNALATGIIEDGNYTVNDVPVGEARIAVFVTDPQEKAKPSAGPGVPAGAADAMGKGPPGAAEHAPPMSGGAKSGGSSKSAVPIPAKYNSPDTSGLTYTVTKGKQNHPIDLN
jgi:hypothetical protein